MRGKRRAGAGVGAGVSADIARLKRDIKVAQENLIVAQKALAQANLKLSKTTKYTIRKSAASPWPPGAI